MGFRFRKSVRVGGARVNIGRRGVTSVSFGKRGRSINVSRRGVRPTFGLPGTGLSYRTARGCCLLPVVLALCVGLTVVVLMLPLRQGRRI